MTNCSTGKIANHSSKRIRGRLGVAIRKCRLARTSGLCEHCLAAEPKRIRIATIVNHKIPLVHGGPDTGDNTENLCVDCDKAETARVFGFKQRQAIGEDGWPV